MRCHVTIKIKKVYWANLFLVVCRRCWSVKWNAMAAHFVARMEALWVSAARVATKFSRLNCLTLEMENNFKLGANSLQVILLHSNTWTVGPSVRSMKTTLLLAAAGYSLSALRLCVCVVSCLPLAHVADGPTANTTTFHRRMENPPWTWWMCAFEWWSEKKKSVCVPVIASNFE